MEAASLERGVRGRSRLQAGAIRRGRGGGRRTLRGWVLRCASALLLAANARASDATFRRGDVNTDGVVDLGDVFLPILFIDPFYLPCWDAADVDDSGRVDLVDGVWILQYLFLGGPEPLPPGPTVPGVDPTPEDFLDCASYEVAPVPRRGEFGLDFESPIVLVGPPFRYEGDAYAALVSGAANLTGATGWSVSIAVDGDDLRIVEATTAGTVAAPRPEGLFRSGFEKTEIVDPALDSGAGPQGPGVVSAVLLDLVRPVTVPAGTTARVLRIGLEAVVPEEGGGDGYTLGTLAFVDGKRGSGQPVQNLVYFEGSPQVPELERREITYRVVDAWERPGDCSGDGQLDLSDPICLLGHLFLGSPERLRCGDGTTEDPDNLFLLDSNGDLRLDISDAIHLLGYLFLGSGPPSVGTACVPMAGCGSRCTP